jgi:predicted transcriptional regulator
MGADDEPRRVHFQSPEYLVDRLDAIAELMVADRTELLVEAMRDYFDEQADSDAFQQRVATAFYEGELDFETVKQLVGAEHAQRLRLLKADLEGGPLGIAAPEDTDIYDGDTVTADER